MTKLFGDMALSNSVKKSIEVIGYVEPTEVQSLAIPEVLNNVDLVVKSKTGSGKTAAFGIPLVDKLKIGVRSPQALVLTPTRELAVQVCEEIALIGKYKKVRCLPLYGKQPIHVQVNQLKQRVHITVGTPGRVKDLINRGHLKLEEISHLVIDEADELLNRGFLEDMREIIGALPVERNTLLFSATMPEAIENVCNEYMREPKWIDIKGDDDIPRDILHLGFEIAEEYKFNRLVNILKEVDPRNALIFCNTQRKVDKVQGLMRNAKLKAKTLHGGMNQRDRLRSIAEFKFNDIPYLVATDLAARGIHVDTLELVINYDMPIDKENYVHRIGRTGRAGEEGLAISFISQHDDKKIEEIEDYLGEKIKRGNIDNVLDSIDKFREGKPKTAKPKKNSTIPKPGANNKATNNGTSTHKDIMKIRINAGKKKKLRPLDVVGAIGNIIGIVPDDIGIVDIRDTCTYIEIFNNKGDLVLDSLTNVKGKNVKVVKIRKPRII